jgi:hypothetical protein
MQGKKFKKSKIGGSTTATAGLNVPGSKASQSRNSLVGTLNNQASQQLFADLENQGAPGSNQLSSSAEDSSAQLKSHIMAQQEEAK